MERPGYDLLPLIVGLLVASAGAFGGYLVVSARHPKNAAAVAAPTPAPARPESLEPQAQSTASLPEPSAPNVPETPPVPAANAESPAAAKIWQCVVNGQRVFADYKCASDATPAQLASTNRMNAAPVAPRRYDGYSVTPPSSPEPEYYNGGDENMASSPLYLPYPVVYAVRPRPVHPHRPPQHPFPHRAEH